MALSSKTKSILIKAMANKVAANEIIDLIEDLEEEQEMANRETLTIGGRTFNDLENLIILYAGQTWGEHSVVGWGGPVGSGLEPDTAWSVPEGKKLIVFAAYGLANGAIGYADSLPRLNTMDPSDLDGQNPVYALPIGEFNQNGSPTPQAPFQTGAVDGGVLITPNFEIPAGKFPFSQGINGIFYCKLVNA